MESIQTGNYQLRYAAGLYWLLDMDQRGSSYQQPLSLNETGARIWKKLHEGLNHQQIAEDLAEHYGVPATETIADVKEFLSLLAARGIVVV